MDSVVEKLQRTGFTYFTRYIICSYHLCVKRFRLKTTEQLIVGTVKKPLLTTLSPGVALVTARGIYLELLFENNSS